MELMIRPAEGRDAEKLLALLHQLQTESTTFMVAQDLETIGLLRWIISVFCKQPRIILF